MPTPEKLNYKLLMSDVKEDEQTYRGKIICSFHHSLNGGGIKMFKVLRAANFQWG